MRTRPSSRWLVVGVLGVAATVTAAALSASTFADPAADNNAAPDLTSVSVTQSAGTTVVLTALVANYQTLPANSWLNVWFDLDSNPNTGDAGDEALVRYLDDGGLQFFRWNGSQLTRQETTGMSASFTAGVLTLTVPTATLDNASTFGVLVVASRGQDVGGDELIASDYVPNQTRSRYVAPGPLTVGDATGDHDSAPDIRGVRVADTRAGLLTFSIATPSHATLPADTWVELDVDIDRRRNTGDGGVELFVGLSGGRIFVGRWDDIQDDFVPVRRSAVRARNEGGVVTLDVPRRLVDDVASFAFYVVSGDSDAQEQADRAIDLAPDGDAWWTYRLANTPPLRLIAGAVRGVPARPRAGARFAAVVPVRRSDTARGITSGSVACKVTVQGRRVASSGTVAGGLARCSLALPQAAHGSVRGSMLIRSGGKSVAVRFAFPIRSG